MNTSGERSRLATSALAALVAFAMLLGLPTAAAAEGMPGDGTPATATEVINFSTGDPAADPGTEGIAVASNGTIYVSANTADGGQIWSIAPGASEPEVLTTLIPPTGGAGFGVLGLHLHRGQLLAAAHTLADPALNGVWRIDPATGDAMHIPGTEAIALPNDLTTWGRKIYVTDSAGGAVWVIDGDDVSVLIQDPLLEGLGVLVPGLPIGANGIDASYGRLYVANLEKGLIVEAKLKRSRRWHKNNGQNAALSLRVFAEVDGAPDGVEVDRWGRVYTVLVDRNQLVRVRSNGSSRAVIDDAAILDAPASLAFGSRRGHRNNIYVVNFSIGEGFPDAIEQSDVGPSVVVVCQQTRRARPCTP